MAGRAHCPFRTADLGHIALNVTPSGPATEGSQLACRTVRLAIFIAGDRSNPTRSERVIAARLHKSLRETNRLLVGNCRACNRPFCPERRRCLNPVRLADRRADSQPKLFSYPIAGHPALNRRYNTLPRIQRGAS